MKPIATQIDECKTLIAKTESGHIKYSEDIGEGCKDVTQRRLDELREKLVMLEYMARDGQRKE